MNVLSVVLIAFAALFLITTPVQADHQPECPLIMSVPGERLESAAVRCGFLPAAVVDDGIGDASRSGSAESGSRRAARNESAARFEPSARGGTGGAGDMARGSGSASTNASARPSVHTVQPGDNLSKLAQAYDTSVDVLMLANPQIINPHLIHVNDELKIPSREETERLRSEAEKRRIAEQRRIVSGVPHNGERWVDVDLRTQTVRAYEGETLMGTFIASTGTSNYPTVTGQFRVWLKLAADDMKGPGYHLKAVPYVMYFFEDYALHGTYWHNNFGTPMSHGCVNLRTEDAEWLFDFGYEGMLVNVH